MATVAPASAASSSNSDNVTCDFAGVDAHSLFSSGVSTQSVPRISEAVVKSDCLSRTNDVVTVEATVWVEARDAITGQWVTIATKTCIESQEGVLVQACSVTHGEPHTSPYSNTERRAFFDIDQPFDLPPMETPSATGPITGGGNKEGR